MSNQHKRFTVKETWATKEMTLSLYQIMWMCYYLESVRYSVDKDPYSFICMELRSLMGADRELIDLTVHYVAASMNHSSAEFVYTVDDWLAVNDEDPNLEEAHRVRKDFLNNMIVELTRVLKEHQYPF